MKYIWCIFINILSRSWVITWWFKKDFSLKRVLSVLDTIVHRFVSVFCFQRYFLSQARGICLSSGSTIPMSLSWLNHPLGHRYFVDASWNCQNTKSNYSCCINEGVLYNNLCPVLWILNLFYVCVSCWFWKFCRFFC